MARKPLVATPPTAALATWIAASFHLPCRAYAAAYTPPQTAPIAPQASEHAAPIRRPHLLFVNQRDAAPLADQAALAAFLMAFQALHLPSRSYWLMGSCG